MMVTRTLVVAWWFSFVSLASLVQAETIAVDYAKFYSNTRKLDAEDTQGLQFAFGFVYIGSGALCQVNSVRLVTPKLTQEIAVSKEYRFVLPSEKALKLAEAVVEIDVTEPANQCDLSVQLETKPSYLKETYLASDLNEIFKQYQAFFNEMGGMLSFMMPQVTGLQLYLAPETQLYSVSDGIGIQGNSLSLPSDWWSRNATLVLSQAPIRITAQTKK